MVLLVCKQVGISLDYVRTITAVRDVEDVIHVEIMVTISLQTCLGMHLPVTL